MGEASARLRLPYLQPGQAQKEWFHNEALTLLDTAVAASVEAVNAVTPPTTPSLGQCWALAAEPVGVWADHGLALAAWSEGGWRFVPSWPGFACWSVADGMVARRVAGGWTVGDVTAQRVSIGGTQVVGPQAPAVPGPVGGNIVDGEARAVIMQLLTALRGHGLIAS